MEHVLVLSKHALSVLHSGLRPFPPPPPPTHHCHFLSAAEPSACWNRSTPLRPSALSTCSASGGSCAPWESGQTQQGPEPALQSRASTFLSSHFYSPSHRRCGFSKPRSQKHTHLTTIPDLCVFHLLGTGTSLIYLDIFSVFYVTFIRLSTSHFVGYCQKKTNKNNCALACQWGIVLFSGGRDGGSFAEFTFIFQSHL